MAARRSLLKWVAFIAVAGAVAALLFAVPDWIDRRVKASRSGPTHVFRLDPAPPFLPDGLALEKARETLARDGYELAEWEPWEDGRSTAPDGARDVYLSRNLSNPNSATILFHDRSGKHPNPGRIVHLELKGDRLECFVVLPK